MRPLESMSPNRKRYKPLRTGKEMAEEFGISYKSLAALLGCDKNSPKPELNMHNHSATAGVVWYRPTEMRKWWKSRTTSAEETTAASSEKAI